MNSSRQIETNYATKSDLLENKDLSLGESNGLRSKEMGIKKSANKTKRT